MYALNWTLIPDSGNTTDVVASTDYNTITVGASILSVGNGQYTYDISAHTIDVTTDHTIIYFDDDVSTTTFQSAVKQSYLKEISRARTFGYMKDVEKMQRQNLALGASMDNAIALSDDDVLNEDGMRYQNEFVKHKILDIVGDLYLLGGNLIGHYEGYKTGHLLNDQLLSAILERPETWSIEIFEQEDSPIQFYSEDWQNSL